MHLSEEVAYLTEPHECLLKEVFQAEGTVSAKALKQAGMLHLRSSEEASVAEVGCVVGRENENESGGQEPACVRPCGHNTQNLGDTDSECNGRPLGI